MKEKGKKKDNKTTFKKEWERNLCSNLQINKHINPNTSQIIL